MTDIPKIPHIIKPTVKRSIFEDRTLAKKIEVPNRDASASFFVGSVDDVVAELLIRTRMQVNYGSSDAPIKDVIGYFGGHDEKNIYVCSFCYGLDKSVTEMTRLGRALSSLGVTTIPKGSIWSIELLDATNYVIKRDG
ncbi:MAG: hypothetical protein AABY07_06910 [Nanoarchaeota archaeon]